MDGTYDYGQWPMVVLSSMIFIIFAFGEEYDTYAARVPAFIPIWKPATTRRVDTDGTAHSVLR